MDMELQEIGLIGLGAIGTVYAAGLEKAYGAHFRVVAGGERAERIQKGVILNQDTFFPQLAAPGWKADLMIFSTKNYDLEQAVADAAPYIKRETVILPVLNGVTAKSVLQSAFPENLVLYGVDMGIDALRTKIGVIVTKPAHIVFGDEWNQEVRPEVAAVKAVLDQAGIENTVGVDMKKEIWRKFMWNIGFNQVTAALDATYEDVAKIPEIYELAERAMFEVYSVAQYMQIDLSTDDILAKRYAYQNAAPFGKTSMAQDMEAHRQTEVDYFSGMLLTMAQKANQLCPVNHALYLLIKSKEKQYQLHSKE